MKQLLLFLVLIALNNLFAQEFDIEIISDKDGYVNIGENGTKNNA